MIKTHLHNYQEGAYKHLIHQQNGSEISVAHIRYSPSTSTHNIYLYHTILYMYIYIYPPFLAMLKCSICGQQIYYTRATAQGTAPVAIPQGGHMH